MIKLATAIFFVITDAGPVPIFRVDTYDLCLRLLEISLADALCMEEEDA